jgi:hypothetical protein
VAKETSITKDIQPVKSIEDKDGVTEVYIVRRLKSGKLEHVNATKNKPNEKTTKVPLLERLKNLTKERAAGDSSWTHIPREVQYKRKSNGRSRHKQWLKRSRNIK